MTEVISAVIETRFSRSQATSSRKISTDVCHQRPNHLPPSTLARLLRRLHSAFLSSSSLTRGYKRDHKEPQNPLTNLFSRIHRPRSSRHDREATSRHPNRADMSAEPSIPLDAIPSSSLWDRITEFVSRNRKTVIYSTAAITVLVTAGGVYYYTQRRPAGDDSDSKRKREKSARKRKQKEPAADEENQLNGNLISQARSKKKLTFQEKRAQRR